MSSGGFLPPEPGGQGPDLTAPPRAAEPQGPDLTAPPRAAEPLPAQASPQPGWGHAPAEPDNGPAVIGFAFSISSIGLLVLSVSFSTVVSLGLGIAGIVMSRKGRRLIGEGHTAKHKDLAAAGFWVGIVSTVLSALATLFWIALAIYIAVDESARQGFEDGFDKSDGDPDPGLLRVAALSVRLLGAVLS